jgi:hypothetical protein
VDMACRMNSYCFPGDFYLALKDAMLLRQHKLQIAMIKSPLRMRRIFRCHQNFNLDRFGL